MKTHEQFADRHAAAHALAAKLMDYRGRNPLVLAIPRGGVPMAAVIAEQLQGECDIVLAHKLGAPFDPEYAIGAIDESGTTWMTPFVEEIGADYTFLEQEKAQQLNALKQRRQQYAPAAAPIDPRDRVVIVVDDGVATGATMIAALHAIRARKPAELACAIPVGPPDSMVHIRPLADRTVCLMEPEDFRGVSQFYRAFPPVEDEEVMAILAHSRSAAHVPFVQGDKPRGDSGSLKR